MNDKNISSTLTVDQTPAEAFAAINDVRGWWSGEIDGNTAKLGDEFTYRYADIHYSKQRIVESVPGKKVVWLVLDCHLNFVNKQEWTGTRVTFEIAEKGGKTEVLFTHVGLTPESECYEACSRGWGFYVNESLRELIATGKGKPNAKEKARNQSQRSA